MLKVLSETNNFLDRLFLKHQFHGCTFGAIRIYKETTNYARLCRLLMDVGSQVLRSTFDKIHPPATLHTVLGSTSVHYATLQSLYKGRKKVLNPTQWGNLYPSHSPVSSATFDITLLTVLLRNICGLSPPANGWDRLPLATNISIADDIA